MAATEKPVTKLTPKTNTSAFTGKAIVIYSKSDGSADAFDGDVLKPILDKAGKDISLEEYDISDTEMLAVNLQNKILLVSVSDNSISTAVYLLCGTDDSTNTSVKRIHGMIDGDEPLEFYYGTSGTNNYIVPSAPTNKIMLAWLNGSSAVEVVDRELSDTERLTFSVVADKDLEAIVGNLATFDENGNPVDSGISSEKFSEIEEEVSELPVEKGTGVNSVQQKGTGAEAISEASVAIGAATYSGTKGFRWTSWDKASLTFTLEKALSKAISNNAWLSVVNDSHYDKCCQVDGNVSAGSTTIKVKTSPFDTKVSGDTGYDAYTIMVVDDPTIGDIDLGQTAHAEGGNTKALQMFSHAEGYGNEALGQYSHAEGRENKAVYAAHAEGRNTEAMASYSHAEGQSTKAYGGKSHAEGTQTETYANNSHTEGYKDIIKDGAGAHAEGYGNVIDITENTAVTTTTATGQSIGAHVEGVSNKLAGIASHAEGRGNKVNEEAAHAEGKNNIASGRASHAEGFTTRAGDLDAPTEQTMATEGWFAHAEGNSTLAKGSASHAEGAGTKALARASHAEGRHSIALGNYSHAEGFDTMAGNPTADVPQPTTIDNTTEGFFAHAEGHHTLAKGNSSHAEGKNTIAEGIASHAEGADNVEGSTPGTDEELLYAKAEGYASHAEGAAHAIGRYSHAEGGGNSIVENKKTVPTAEGSYSHAEGTHTYAKGNSSHAEGSLTEAIGDRAHAEGQNTIASGNQAHTEGKYTKATAAHSHAEGFGSDDGSAFVEATAVAAHAEGQATKASAQGAHAEGYKCEASGTYSHAEGRQTVADEDTTHAEGKLTLAKGKFSHSEGNLTFAVGAQSHASGFGSSSVSTFTVSGAAHATTYNTSAAHGLTIGSIIEYEGVHASIESVPSATSFTTNATLSATTLTNVSVKIRTGVALGICAYTEGYQNIAVNNQNHAEGSGTRAIGKQSHTQGYQTRAYNNVEHAEGRWNKSNKYSNTFGDAGNTIHSVGIGTADNNRKNAFEIMQNGDAYLYGVGDYEGNNLKTDKTKPSKTVQDAIKSLENDSVWEDGSGKNSVQQKGTGAGASGVASVAEGADNLQGGNAGKGEELLYAKAEGYASHAEGAAHAIGRYSHAEGGGNSIEEGHPTRSTAEGPYSHAEGTHTYAIGNGSHAEGQLTIARNNGSHAEGKYSIADGLYSHAEGFITKANAGDSHAEGGYTIAEGMYSHAEGFYTQTNNNAEHAEGQWNKSNTGSTSDKKTIHTVGIGTSSSNRKNAFEIMQNGDIYLYNVGNYRGKLNSTSKTIQQVLNSYVTEPQVLSLIPTLSPYTNAQIDSIFDIGGGDSSDGSDGDSPDYSQYDYVINLLGITAEQSFGDYTIVKDNTPRLSSLIPGTQSLNNIKFALLDGTPSSNIIEYNSVIRQWNENDQEYQLVFETTDEEHIEINQYNEWYRRT